MNVLTINAEECVFCRTCEAGCSAIKEGESNLSKSRISVVPFYEEYFYCPTVCRQCTVPACIPACPEEAIFRNEDTGVVELEQSKCSGCRMCLDACPFGAIVMVDGLAAKCDLCGGDPWCVRLCQYGALHYGESNEISTSRRLKVAERMRESYLAASQEK